MFAARKWNFFSWLPVYNFSVWNRMPFLFSTVGRFNRYRNKFPYERFDGSWQISNEKKNQTLSETPEINQNTEFQLCIFFILQQKKKMPTLASFGMFGKQPKNSTPHFFQVWESVVSFFCQDKTITICNRQTSTETFILSSNKKALQTLLPFLCKRRHWPFILHTNLESKRFKSTKFFFFHTAKAREENLS